MSVVLSILSHICTHCKNWTSLPYVCLRLALHRQRCISTCVPQGSILFYSTLLIRAATPALSGDALQLRGWHTVLRVLSSCQGWRPQRSRVCRVYRLGVSMAANQPTAAELPRQKVCISTERRQHPIPTGTIWVRELPVGCCTSHTGYV